MLVLLLQAGTVCLPVDKSPALPLPEKCLSCLWVF